MKASKVKLALLNSYADHDNIIERIETDPQNVVGGARAWVSGRQTFLKQGAINKVAAIRRQQTRKFPCEED